MDKGQRSNEQKSREQKKLKQQEICCQPPFNEKKRAEESDLDQRVVLLESPRARRSEGDEGPGGASSAASRSPFSSSLSDAGLCSLVFCLLDDH